MFCKYCGKQIDDNSTFCNHCGKKLNDSPNSSSSSWLKEVLSNKEILTQKKVVLGILYYCLVLIFSIENSKDYDDFLWGDFFEFFIVGGVLIPLLSYVGFRYFKKKNSKVGKVWQIFRVIIAHWKAIVLYLVWFVVHLYCLLFAESSKPYIVKGNTLEPSELFFPISHYIYGRGTSEPLYCYDSLEFTIYLILPFVLYPIYYFTKKKNPNFALGFALMFALWLLPSFALSLFNSDRGTAGFVFGLIPAFFLVIYILDCKERKMLKKKESHYYNEER